jgi:hypothetical protein
MDAGIGESMLIGAALGGGTSALTGKNPLLGAGIGALGGAIAPALGEAFSGAGAAAAEAPVAESFAVGAGDSGSDMMGAITGDEGSSSMFGKGITMGSNTGVPSGSYGLNAINPPGAPGLSMPNYVAPTDSVMPGVNNAVAANAGKTPGMLDSAMNWVKEHPFMTAGGVGLGALMLNQQNQYKPPGQETYTGPLSHYSFNPYTYQPAVAPTYGSPYIARAAEGGLMSDYDSGGITSLTNTGMYPGSQQNNAEYARSTQMPNPAMRADYDPETNPYTGDISQNMAEGGITSLGSYSDGGHLLKGPGDGMSDDIPARIGHKQEARLADGEFVIPADVVSHLGNGSTDAGAKQLYNMMDKVRQARTGNLKQGKRIDPEKHMPKFADGGPITGYGGNFGGSYPQYSYADLMSQLRSNPQAFARTPAVNPNNQQMGIQSLANNAAIAQAQQVQPVMQQAIDNPGLYNSGSGGA